MSVVIPAYDEAARILPTLERVREWLAANQPGSEIIVVDDGSSDETASRVEDFSARSGDDPTIRCLRLPHNRGKGAAVRMGVLAADRPLLLYTDADLSTPIEEADKLVATLDGGADVAIGSRSVRGAQVEVRQPLYRVLMGKTFNKAMRLVTFLGVVDSQCGFKLFRRDVAHRLFAASRIDSFAFDVEILFLARQAGLSVAEVPVRWLNDARSTVHPLWDSLKMLEDVLRIRWIHRAGRV